ncbi:hypothetical protein BD309DRAFT_339618 [Dichomitus squalens]|nr:hypothetical protein BD309DRAFT_339618 [Dichomitus squalens]
MISRATMLTPLRLPLILQVPKISILALNHRMVILTHTQRVRSRRTVSFSHRATLAKAPLRMACLPRSSKALRMACPLRSSKATLLLEASISHRPQVLVLTLVKDPRPALVFSLSPVLVHSLGLVLNPVGDLSSDLRASRFRATLSPPLLQTITRKEYLILLLNRSPSHNKLTPSRECKSSRSLSLKRNSNLCHRLSLKSSQSHNRKPTHSNHNLPKLPSNSPYSNNPRSSSRRRRLSSRAARPMSTTRTRLTRTLMYKRGPSTTRTAAPTPPVPCTSSPCLGSRRVPRPRRAPSLSTPPRPRTGRPSGRLRRLLR